MTTITYTVFFNPTTKIEQPQAGRVYTVDSFMDTSVTTHEREETFATFAAALAAAQAHCGALHTRNGHGGRGVGFSTRSGSDWVECYPTERERNRVDDLGDWGKTQDPTYACLIVVQESKE